MNLSLVGSTLFVKYKNKVDNKKEYEIMSTKEDSNLGIINIQKYHKNNISIMKRPLDERDFSRVKITNSLAGYKYDFNGFDNINSSGIVNAKNILKKSEEVI